MFVGFVALWPGPKRGHGRGFVELGGHRYSRIKTENFSGGFIVIS